MTAEWVFALKTDRDAFNTKTKARLLARGSRKNTALTKSRHSPQRHPLRPSRWRWSCRSKRLATVPSRLDAGMLISYA